MPYFYRISENSYLYFIGILILNDYFLTDWRLEFMCFLFKTKII